MSSFFSFGFHGDDIDPEDEAPEDAPQSTPQTRQGGGAQLGELHQPHIHTLEDMLSTLPSSISYSYLDIPSPNSIAQKLRVPRRELFDVRMQIMAEDTDGEHAPLLADLDKGDLRPNVYEGGFKTWECAIDLAKVVLEEADELWGDGTSKTHVIELGAGTAIPTLALYQSWLRRPRNVQGSVRFTLCDYNEIVLRLVSLPNVLLAANTCIWPPEMGEEDEEGELDVSEELRHSFPTDMRHRGLEIDFVSGAWSKGFVHLVDGQAKEGRPGRTLILASETIYSPVSLVPFTLTLIGLLQRRSQNGGEAKALVAAKRVYFGVGGGVDEFIACVTGFGGKVKERLDVRDGGVGRVVLEVTVADQT